MGLGLFPSFDSGSYLVKSYTVLSGEALGVVAESLFNLGVVSRPCFAAKFPMK